MSAERRPHLWCIFDKRTSRVIEGLLFDEARAYLSNQDAADLEHFWLWKEEWPDWRPVSEVEGITEMIFRALHVSPPPPPRGTEELSNVKKLVIKKNNRDEEDSDAIITSANFPQQSLEGIDLAPGDFIVRSQKRFRKRMQITIVGDTKDKVFRTFTRDISVGGMYLEDSAPGWIQGHFKVRIAKPHSKQLIELNCVLIDQQAAGARFRIAILPLQSPADEKNLENWLAA